MPRPSSRDPKYRLHKARGLAVVSLFGKDHYLGKYGSPESKEAYHRLIAELHTGRLVPGRVSATANRIESEAYLGLNVLIESYLSYAREYYQSEGKPNHEFVDITYSLEPVSTLFGLSDARTFGPKALKLVQQHMIARDWSRRLINQRINRVRRMFKWAVAEELVPPSVLEGLRAVPGLRYGRTTARETEPVRPVDDAHIDAILPYVTRQVAALIQLQRLTGMRPCEVVAIRPRDIDRSGKIWVYEPASHKNQWRGHRRTIPLGPRAQQLIAPFLNRPEGANLFSPREAEEERNAGRRRNRKTPMTPSQAKRRKKVKPKKAPMERYTVDSYRRAIEYGVKMANKKKKPDAAKIPKWYPLQLRHTRATEVRKRYGLDGAQSALGHKNADVTQVYAEKNLELAIRIAEETG